MYKHEDDRRILYDLDLPPKVGAIKVLRTNTACTVGDHYHLKKDELFYLVAGAGTYRIGEQAGTLTSGVVYDCPRGTRHTFWLRPDAILLGIASEPFDEADEHHD